MTTQDIINSSSLTSTMIIDKMDDMELSEDEMSSLIASMENLHGPSLILWLTKLQVVTAHSISSE